MDKNTLIVKKMWNLLDEAFFDNKKIKDFTKDGVLIEKYNIIKSSLISEVIELNKLTKTDFNFFIKKENKKIIKTAKLLSEKIINLEKTRKIIKENVKYLLEKDKDKDIESILNKYIKEMSLSLYIDNLLIYPFIKENRNFDNLFEGDKTKLPTIIRYSYNMFKNEMVSIITEIVK